MQPSRPSIWLPESNCTASRKPGTLQPAEAKFLRDGFAAHPQFQPEYREGKGWSFQPRRAAFFWGLNWRLNAAVRLLEIAETARAWNRTYRPGKLGLPAATARKSASPIARAIVAVRFRWAAEHDPAAALTLLGKTLTKKQKVEEQFENLTPEDVDPLTIDLHLGDKAGLDLLAQVKEEYHRLPSPGELGYTARSQAHLWLDAVGDDIDHYRRHQADASRRHQKAIAGELPPELQDPSRVPPEVVALLGRGHGISPASWWQWPQSAAYTRHDLRSGCRRGRSDSGADDLALIP
jgi:hypothetical protein